MNNGLSLSIALATYNGERYLAEQLDSIAQQTRLPDELIITDDASIDATSTLVLDFAKRAPFTVRFQVNNERLGSTRNFERAIRVCNGDIIFLCDQDDVWYPSKIALMEERFIKNPSAGAVFTDADVVGQDMRPFGKRLWKTFRFSREEQERITACDALNVLLKHSVVTGATMAFRSTYRDLVLPLPDTWHDAWIALLIGTTSCLDAIPKPLIAYRQHNSNQLGIPRRGRNQGKTCASIYGPQVVRYEAARTRLLELGDRFPITKQKMHSIEEMLLFLRARSALPNARWRRLRRALRELVALRYHRYAYGMASFRKDLLR